ncbi:MAG: protein phosphatase 2C domain-containing protein [Polyangiaceae bacterium]
MIEVAFGEATDPGLDPNKRVNEDACRHVDTALGPLFIVCDGMGGHAGGKQASDIAVNSIAESFSSLTATSEPRDSLKSAIETAAHKVYDFGGSKEQAHRPGCTCVAMLLHRGRAVVAHVGDSRCYGIRGDQIYHLTRDHSVVQQMLDNGLISRQQAVGHPDANKITRALGMTRDVAVELREEPVELFVGDVFVLCTDGLTDMARDVDIMLTTNQYMGSDGPQRASDELVALANRRGGNDNITVQLVKILSAGPKDHIQTLAQSPASNPLHAGSPVPTTVNGAPAMAPLSVSPASVSPASAAPASAAPSAVSPTIAEAPAQPSTPMANAPPSSSVRDAQTAPSTPPMPAMSRHRRPPPIPSQPTSNKTDRTISLLIKIVLILVAMTGFLVAALLWALLYR